MIATSDLMWRPFHDEPLFTDELLRGIGVMHADMRQRLVAYLEQVAGFRRLPLHVTTAFNALHFGFDLETGGYRAEVLDPELFVRLAPGGDVQPVLPVGAFVRLERGQQSLWAEVVARFGAHPDVDPDGWLPAALSGAPVSEQVTGNQPLVERVVLDPEAFGAPLNPAERAELARLRRRNVLLDERGHLTGPVHYPDPGLTGRGDTELYAHYMLTTGRPLLVGGPLGGLLTEPEDDDILAVALQVALETVDALLSEAPNMRRWGAYATTSASYRQRRISQKPLGGADLDELAYAATRATAEPRFTAVWPLLSARVDAARKADPDEIGVDPLDLAGAAEAVVHANLALADLATGAVDGYLPNGVHLRVDDLWQGGGIWRTQRGPVSADLLQTDPLRPLGLGYRQSRNADSGNGGDGTDEGRTPASREGLTDQDAVAGSAAVKSTMDGGPYNGESADDPRIKEDPWTGDEPERGPELAPETDGITVDYLDDSIIVFTAALRQTYIDNDILPLPADADSALADGPLVVELHHNGGGLLDTERVQRVQHDGGKLAGIAWPLSFYPGIQVTVAAAQKARRLSATTTLLAQPLPYGEEFRWAADLRLLAASLGLPADSDTPRPDEDDEMATVGEAPTVAPRHRGIDPLRRLIVATLRRHGMEGAFGARRLTGPQLTVAMFGASLVSPKLMWQVIYTCERLVDAGKLTCEPNPGHTDRPGSGGPDTFVWWPNQAARNQAEQQTTAVRQAALRGRVREHWVPPGCRALPDGYRPSEQAKEAYAKHVRALRGPSADPHLPQGYTFVRGHARGTSPGPIWLPPA